MNARQLDALESAAAEGVSFDGLRAERDETGFLLETPEVRRDGLDAAAFRKAVREAAPYVTNWDYWRRVGDPESARYAFLRWVERADERGVPIRYDDLEEGATRTWGELAVTARVVDGGGDGEGNDEDESDDSESDDDPDTDGESGIGAGVDSESGGGADGDREAGARVYELRHVDDADRDRNELEARADPREAREIARFDGRGRYRPLKTAPTLPTGWVFVGLDGRELVRTVDFFYPATVENWRREREGALDVTHWRETAERQTGIYDVVDELPEEAVEWAAEACCVDSQCLKRRRWDYDEGADLDVERGDGEFPCREPCSLFVAAAREWALAEREEPRTYEFELTPGEKAQLEEIVDAVAEGRTDEIREADFDDGANRYRVRYLRAKLFDET